MPITREDREREHEHQMKIDIVKEWECGSVHIAIEYKSEYEASLIRALWDEVKAHVDRILASLEADEERDGITL